MSEKIRLILRPQSYSMRNALGFYPSSTYYDTSDCTTDNTSQNELSESGQAKELSELAELREKILREASTPVGGAKKAKAKKAFKRPKGGTS